MVPEQVPGLIQYARIKWNRRLRTGADDRQGIRAVPVYTRTS
jgi:hypothetical protein